MYQTSISNVEAFSGHNEALTTLEASFDYLKVTENDKCTISLSEYRMRNYVSDEPFSVENTNAIIQAVACFDKNDNPFKR